MLGFLSVLYHPDYNALTNIKKAYEQDLDVSPSVSNYTWERYSSKVLDYIDDYLI